MDQYGSRSNEALFRSECLTFLDAHAVRRHPVTDRGEWGRGSDRVALFDEEPRSNKMERLTAGKAWRRLRFDQGLGWISGPVALGGRGYPSSFEHIYNSLEAQFEVPDQSFFRMGTGVVAPTIVAVGHEWAQRKYLAPILRGDILACQLFSEPSAGSDLAGVQARARRRDGGWVIDGQKVWTSHADCADLGLAICRTDDEVERHAGLTAFLVDMHSPGVEVRPLRQMTGGATFNEVFLDGVPVSDINRIGEEGDGWRVASLALKHERDSIGTGTHGSSGLGLANGRRLIELVRHLGCADDPLVRQELVQVYIGFQVAKMTSRRAAVRMRSGARLGAELTILKLALAANLRATSAFVSRVLGPRVVADSTEWGTYAWSQLVLGEPASHIAGGSDEVLKNLVAERALGLPR